MKKSKTITLVLITSALASCHKEKPENDWSGPKVHMRSDTTAAYTRTHHYGMGVGSALLWYYAFRPYRGYNGGQYGRAGYYSSGIHQSSNVGRNATKSSIVRGGFGRGSSVSS
jgi:hypothetical protein